MTCQSIVSPPPAILTSGDTIAHAAATLLAQGVATLPVVDGQGRFAGIFGTRELIGLMLPRAASLGTTLDDLGFVADTAVELNERLSGRSAEIVDKHMAPHQTVRPHTALAEALFLLYRGDSFLPVVDDAGKLVGIVTAVDALAKIAGAAS